MLFAQFYKSSALDTSKIIEGTGDRSIIILDARHSITSNIDIAEIECKKRGYIAFAIGKGESFTRSFPITDILYIGQL